MNKNILKNQDLTVNLFYLQDGVIKVSAKNKNNKKLKIIIAKGNNSLHYDIRNDGIEETFPIEYGNGLYHVSLYENVYQNKYTIKGSIFFNVKLNKENAYELHANQYVNYEDDSDIIKLTKKICKNETDENIYKIICQYIQSNYRYDYVKALLQRNIKLPEIHESFKKKMGICQDLAATAVAMLRSQNIPAKLMIGKADNQNHAWVSTTINNKEILFDPTKEIEKKKNAKKYNPERWY